MIDGLEASNRDLKDKLAQKEESLKRLSNHSILSEVRYLHLFLILDCKLHLPAFRAWREVEATVRAGFQGS